jgi:hypothetical protein
MWYSNLEKKTYLDISSTNIGTLIPVLYQCVETRSVKVSLLFSQPLPHLRFILCEFRTSFREFLDRAVNCLCHKHHHKQEILIYEYPLHWVLMPYKNAQEETALRYYTLKQSRHFDHRNQPQDMRMRVCYVHCHEADLCSYLVIHIEILLHPLNLFYFNFWPI